MLNIPLDLVEDFEQKLVENNHVLNALSVPLSTKTQALIPHEKDGCLEPGRRQDSYAQRGQW